MAIRRPDSTESESRGGRSALSRTGAPIFDAAMADARVHGAGGVAIQGIFGESGAMLRIAIPARALVRGDGS